MRIIFDLRRVGLGNNGGSLTLIKSGNALVELGHDVFFIDSSRNQHIWTPLKAKHMIVKDEKRIPDADFIIATGYRSVDPTCLAPDRCGIKAHYIRGWETWQMSEKQIVKRVLKRPTIKIVNGIGLQEKLKSYGISSYIIRPGYDFDQIYPTHKRKSKKRVVLGGIYLSGARGNRKRTTWLFEAARHIKGVEFWLFGNERAPQDHLVDKYVRSPSPEEKNEFYNSIDIWMAPSYLEGLHIPPAEAMMTECPVVGTDAKLSGIEDYVINGKTGLLSNNNLSDFISVVELLVKDNKMRERMGKQGRKKIIEIGDRKKNMQKMIDLFTEFIS